MNEIIVDDKKVEDMIYEIRGKQVMLDSDLAKLYQCKNGTKTINLAVKRNINRFPDDFYFQLSDEDIKILRFQNETANHMTRTKSYVFTEQGIAMLATVLKTKVASNVSIKIMRTFVEMRKYINSSLIEQKYINNVVIKHEDEIKHLYESFDKMKENTKVSTIFYYGEIYDAYSLLFKILNKAKSKIIIIDNYAGIELFDLIKEIKVKIIVYTKNVNNELLKKYNKEYNNLEIIKCELFHDRFIIIDNKILYHSGASFKDLGNKCFALSLIEDEKILKGLLKYMKEKINKTIVDDK